MSPHSRESVSFDRIADRYDETRGGEKRGRELSGEVAKWLVPGTSLEVGVGTGLIAQGLTDRGASVVGVDISPAMLARAHARLGPRVAIGDAMALPVATGSVANVYFVWVLHLVGDVGATLAEAARVLRPGGRVIVLHGTPRQRTELDEALAPLAPFRTIRQDETDTIAELARGMGLTEVHRGYTEGYPLRESPAYVAEQMERKTWSWLWKLDETQWQSVAVPTIAALRAMPDPDREREFLTDQPILVLSRP
jgi:ubiquinone/menaquinone biosynthesis C-methylase UbiE